MAEYKVRIKWRPPLAFVVYSVLLSVMALPVLIIVWFRATETPSIQITRAEIGAFIAAIGVTLLIAYVLTRTISGPINALVKRTEEVARGGKAAIRPLESHGTREIATLSQSFLDLAGKLVDRSEYVRSFAMHVSHELKSPLTAIRGAAELLREDDENQPMTQAQRATFLDNIIADTKRLDSLLLRLRELANAELSFTEGQTQLEEIAPSLRTKYPAIEITISGATALPFALPAEAAGIIFGNLAENAIQHGATRLELTASAEDRKVAITIKDNGRGISEANREQIFRPFFSTRREQGGTGMGLDIVRAVLGAHGGTITLGASVDGAEFVIVVPEGS